MRIFVTGASGWIGSAVVPELIDAGHTVVGLARSDDAARTVAASGAEVVRGRLDELDVIRAGAEDSDGVVHLGYIHDFSQMGQAADTDRAVIDTVVDVLAGSDRPLLIASGTLGLSPGRAAIEGDDADPSAHPRIANAHRVLAAAERGVRSIVVRFAPTVHGAGDHGFIKFLVEIARTRGESGYLGDGANRWPAVHRLDAAHLVRLAIDNAPAGSVLHAVAEEGIPTRTIAEAIGAGLDVPVVSVAPDQATDHFQWMGAFFGVDAPASSVLTRERTGWEPSGPTLLDDLASGSYFA